MAGKQRVNEEVEKTLSLMDRMERLEAGPYFYIRLEARLQEARLQEARLQEARLQEAQLRSVAEAPRQWLPSFLGGRILQPVMLALLMVINIVSVVYFAAGPIKTNGKEKALQTYVASLTTGYADKQGEYGGYSSWDSSLDVFILKKMSGETD